MESNTTLVFRGLENESGIFSPEIVSDDARLIKNIKKGDMILAYAKKDSITGVSKSLSGRTTNEISDGPNLHTRQAEAVLEMPSVIVSTIPVNSIPTVVTTEAEPESNAVSSYLSEYEPNAVQDILPATQPSISLPTLPDYTSPTLVVSESIAVESASTPVPLPAKFPTGIMNENLPLPTMYPILNENIPLPTMYPIISEHFPIKQPTMYPIITEKIYTKQPTMYPIITEHFSTKQQPTVGSHGNLPQASANAQNSNISFSLLAYSGPILVALIALCIFWRFYNCWRRRRNNRMLSAEADMVLGDMQMVPSDDFDVPGLDHDVNDLL